MGINNQDSGLRACLADRFVQTNLLVGLLINIALWVVLILPVREFTELIPLHYNIYFGIDLLGYWYRIFLMPVLGLVVFTVNLFLTAWFFLKEKTIGYFLIGASTFVQLILLLAGMAIIFVIS